MKKSRKEHFGGLGAWKSYEYIGAGPGDIFHPAHYAEEGGPAGQAFVWADDTMWSIDTPEDPHSILVLLHYQLWDNQDGFLDLRDGTIEFSLRGDDLALHGARCFFWVSSLTNQTTRWHYIGQPLSIANRCWEDPVEIKLVNHPDLWHRSFASDPKNPCSLDETLGSVFSYGFSFVGFSRTVTGRFSMGAFAYTPHQHSKRAFSGGALQAKSCWQTVSYAHKRQNYITEINRSILTPGKLFVLENDFLVIQNRLPYAYLGFIHSDESVRGKDLRNARIIVVQFAQELDLKGGEICFFIENASTGTTWITRGGIPTEGSWVIHCDEHYWYRLTGSAPLASVLAGDASDSGYDYFGFMAVDVTDRPTGCWGLRYLSLMPMN